MISPRSWTTLVAAALLLGCADHPTDSPSALEADGIALGNIAEAPESHLIEGLVDADPAAFFLAEMDAANAALEAAGADVRVGVAEIFLAPGAPDNAGTTIYANNRTLELGYHWVPGDERRGADGHNLTYLVDESRSYAYTRNSYPAMEYLGDWFEPSFAPWQDLTCGNVNIVRRPDTGADPSIMDGSPGQWWLADIVEAGWRPLPRGVLGVAYTFIFTQGGVPTDVNGDGKYDSALSEIWYSSRYYWTVDETRGIDLLSVAIHENGHALGIGHFGKLFVTDANGVLHFAPRAVMNAAYVSRMQDLQGTDEASYCGLYSDWP